MVKATLLIASVAALMVSSVTAQIPDEIESIVRSIASNPAGFQSELASISAQATNLPTQYQGQVNSALAAASKTLDSIKPKETGTGSSGNPASKPATYVAAVAAAVAVGVLA